MGTVIKNNMSAVRTLNILNKNNAALQSSMLKVSSGQKINSGADDAAGLIISEKMRHRIRSDQQANRNVQTGTAMLRVAEGALGNITEILHTMKEKALQAANNVAGSATDDAKAIAKELSALAEQITMIATDTKFNGRTLINGSAAITLQIGPEAGQWMQALSAGIKMTASALSLTGIGASIFTGSVGGTTATFLSKISTALSKVLNAQADVAKVQSRLNYQADNLTSEAENTQAAESVIRDTDMSSEMVNFMKWNVLSQASQMMLAQAGQNAYSVLNLLQQ
jgi:flagellin